jgi:hypothetical protein
LEVRQQPHPVHGLGPKHLPLAVYPSSALAASAAHSLDSFLAVVTQRAEEHPSLQAVEAVALLAALVLVVGGGVFGALR